MPDLRYITFVIMFSTQFSGYMFHLCPFFWKFKMTRTTSPIRSADLYIGPIRFTVTRVLQVDVKEDVVG